MVSKPVLSICLFVLCLPGNFAKAQHLDDYLTKYTAENGKGYLQPLITAYEANLNSGLYWNANIKKRSLQIHMGLTGAGVFVPDKEKTFMARPEGLFEPKEMAEVSTVFGSGESVTVNSENGTSYTFPGGLNINAFLLLIPQVTIGSLWGTDFTIRYFSYNYYENIGRLNLLGLGMRHSISQYIPNCPVDLAFGYYWHYSRLSDIVSVHSNLISLQSSYTKNRLTFYGGVGFSSSTLNIDYIFEKEDVISFELDDTNHVRLTLGMAFKINPVVLNLEYSLARQSALSVGIGLHFEKN